MNDKDDKYEIETEVREVAKSSFINLESILNEDEMWADEEHGGLEIYLRQEGGRLKRLVVKPEEEKDD